MRNPRKLAVFVVGTSTLALLLATSAFAETRHRDGTWRGDQLRGDSRTSDRNGGNRDQNRNNEHNNNGNSDRRGSDRSSTDNRSNDNRAWNNQDNRGRGGDTRALDNNRSRGDNRTWDNNRSRSDNRAQDNNRGRSDNRAWDNNNRGRSDNRAWDDNNRGRSDNRAWDNSRGRSDNRAWDNNRGDSRGNREAFRNGIPRSDGRVTMLGRINRYERDRDGYRVWFGGSGYPYWVPESYFRGRRIGIGLDLRLGGIFRNGSVFVDVLGWPGDPYYNDPYYNDGNYGSGGGYYGGYDSGYVRGTVDAVDYRTATLYLRDDATRRVITVDMRRIERRNSRLDIDELRRGDRVTLSGSWFSGGVFAADRIDSIDAY